VCLEIDRNDFFRDMNTSTVETFQRIDTYTENQLLSFQQMIDSFDTHSYMENFSNTSLFSIHKNFYLSKIYKFNRLLRLTMMKNYSMKLFMLDF